MPTHRKRVSDKQRNRIRALSYEGKSTTQIQHTLQKEHIGLRRKVLLRYIRRYKGRETQPHTAKYIPRKHAVARRRGLWIERAKAEERNRRKQVVLQGLVNGERVQKTRSGTGKDLYDFVKDEVKNGPWDHKPHVIS